MPYSWKVDLDTRTAYVRGWGAYDLKESLEAPHQLLGDPSFDPGCAVIVDLLELEMNPGPDDVVAIARNMIALKSQLRGRLAVVVPARLTTAAEVSGAMAAAGGVEMRVCTTHEEAQRFVDGVDDD